MQNAKNRNLLKFIIMPYSQKNAEQSLKRLFPEEYEKIQSNKSYYQRLNDSKLGQALDYVDLGLDYLSMFPGPVGVAAGTLGVVTGLPQGTLAIADMIKNKDVNMQNFTDAMKILPAGNITKTVARKLLSKFSKKTDKYAKRAHPYFPKKSKTVLPDQASGVDMTLEDRKYLPYFLPYWGLDAVNLGTDIMHIKNNE